MLETVRLQKKNDKTKLLLTYVQFLKLLAEDDPESKKLAADEAELAKAVEAMVKEKQGMWKILQGHNLYIFLFWKLLRVFVAMWCFCSSFGFQLQQ
jgi:hypothetical protein